MSFKKTPGPDFVAATIGHACIFSELNYNPKIGGEPVTPLPNVNVYAREEKTWVMGQQGDLVPINIRIEVW